MTLLSLTNASLSLNLLLTSISVQNNTTHVQRVSKLSRILFIYEYVNVCFQTDSIYNIFIFKNSNEKSPSQFEEKIYLQRIMLEEFLIFYPYYENTIL